MEEDFEMINSIFQLDINQLLLTTIMLSSVGMLGFWIKDIPKRLGNFFIRQCTTTLEITSYHQSFYQLMNYIQRNS